MRARAKETKHRTSHHTKLLWARGRMGGVRARRFGWWIVNEQQYEHVLAVIGMLWGPQLDHGTAWNLVAQHADVLHWQAM